MTERHKIDPKDIKWDEVERAAKSILGAVESARYCPPEAMGYWVNHVCAQMNRIAEALCFSKLPPDEKQS